MNPTRRRFQLLVFAVALGAIALLVVQAAGASHVRPKGASPLRASVVPAYKACTAPNTTHGAPLAFPSCNPPVQSSNFLTVGTPDANGAGAQSISSILLNVIPTAPEDVKIDSTGTDIRCFPATSATVCNSANAADGPDYSGGVQGNATIRISDHYNGPSLNQAATVTDIPFPVNGTCVNTASTAIGGQCDTHTTANAVVPGSVKNTQRAVVEISQLQIFDGGASGTAGAADATLFGVQGIFIP